MNCEKRQEWIFCASLTVSQICKFTHLITEFFSIYTFLFIFVSKCFLRFTMSRAWLVCLNYSQSFHVHSKLCLLHCRVRRRCSSHADHFSCSKLKWGWGVNNIARACHVTARLDRHNLYKLLFHVYNEVTDKHNILFERTRTTICMPSLEPEQKRTTHIWVHADANQHIDRRHRCTRTQARQWIDAEDSDGVWNVSFAS